MRFLFLLAAFFSMAAARAELPYQDNNFGCISESEANQYVRDFGIDAGSFGGVELCDGARETKKLFNDLYLIKNAKFEASGDHSFIRGFVDRNGYYDWMKGETRGVRRGHDIPYATAYNSWGYFTMQDGWAVLSTLGRVGTIIHEARHTAGYRHYRCETGPYAASSVSGCDTHYGQGGSHAIEMEYYARVVLEAKNLHPAYQSMARLMALGRSNFVFNENPMRKREGLLGLSQGKVVLVDNGRVYERGIPQVEEGYRLKRTSFGASLVKGERAVALDLSIPAAVEVLSDDYSYYKLFQTPRSRSPRNVVDTEEFDSGNLRFFTALTSEGEIASYDFPTGDWFARPVGLSGASALVTRAPNGEEGLFVVAQDGSIYPYEPRRRQLGSPLKDRWLADTAAFAMLGNQLVRLTSEGAVVEARSGVPVASLAKYRFTDLVNVPLYDAFELAH